MTIDERIALVNDRLDAAGIDFSRPVTVDELDKAEIFLPAQ